ncbi:MAG: NAD-dependent epimerase/dehydratase family protein [Mariprofundales bacterium]
MNHKTRPSWVLGVTGADGLIGWHVRAFFHGVKHVRVLAANRQSFASEAMLDAFVAKCDAIVHLAGINRADDDALERGNISLTEQLIAALERVGVQPHILFSSSTHVLSCDSAYARGKKGCSVLWQAWVQRHQARFTNMILPHVFGEGGRPFYNSVVSTFCHQLARSETPQVVHDGDLELLHAQDVAAFVLQAVENGHSGEARLHGSAICVSALRDVLQTMHREYFAAYQFPVLTQALHLNLFNVLRSYCFPQCYPLSLVAHKDARGYLYEAVKGQQGGQCFVSGTHPGVTRGNHYHRRKVERFLVISGDAVIRVRRIFSDQVHAYSVSGREPVCVDMPTFHVHNISNCGSDELITLFWAHEVFDAEQPDTYAELVEQSVVVEE